ncbi:MAG: M4 family metallopeptidase [Thermoanaerobaculia bacterium]
MSRGTHAVCGFLPPHILRSIAEKTDDPDLRERCHVALETSAQFRGARIAIGNANEGFLASGLRRTIYDAQRKTTLPGKLLRAEGAKPVADVAAGEAYDGAGITYDFYSKIYGRNSVDGRGLPLDSSIHYGLNYTNALWNGKQMIYGDGDGKLFNGFTGSLDIIGHELTHGVTQHTAALVYQDQSGALNEHFSDVFGILVKQYALKQTAAKSDWLIGAGIFTKAVHGTAVRSMKAPGTAYDDKLLGNDPQPAHMRNYQTMTSDNGGVHVNSGIPNHAFYLAATLLGGKAWSVAGQIWYDALTTLLKPKATFRDCARATAAAASKRYGANSEPARSVIEAWKEVGIDLGAIVTTGPKLALADFEPPAPAAELPPFEQHPPRRAAK